jgi:predicted DsbA family dithiol-disulfide isomerase
MKIEIWSDIMCPFCYIGKRKLESALAQFHGKNNADIRWHSFQLDPSLKYEPEKDLYAYLSERKGISLEHSKHLHDQLTQTAKENGLMYNFDKAVIANSFDAHRFIQMAKEHDLGDAAEERLFKAYFTEGKNVADHRTLIELGHDIGLKQEEVSNMLQSRQYTKEVKNDIEEARLLGIKGVPFFVMNRKYAVSGAQPVELFLQTLNVAYKEWEKENSSLTHIADADSCVPGEDCA